MKALLRNLSQYSKWFSSADSLSFIVLLSSIGLVPLITLPLWSVPPAVAKQFFVPVVVLVVFVLYLVARLESGVWRLPKSAALATLGLPFIATGLSALASTYRPGSFFGIHFDIGTVISLSILCVLTILSTLLISSKERLVNLYVVLLGAGLIAGIYQLGVFLLSGLLGYFGANLSFWIVSLPLSLIGRWYESAIFFGFIAGVALVFLEFLSLDDNRLFKRLMLATLVVALLCVALVNFYLVWIALALWSVGVFVYATMTTSGGQTKKTILRSLSILRPSFVVLVISIMFLTLATSGGVLTKAVNYLYTSFNVPVIEVRPDLVATWTVAKGVLAEDPLVGVGANQFVNAWLLYKPNAVKLSPFWQVDFNVGVGTLPTWWVVTGIVGLLSWLVFLGLLLHLTIKVCRRVVTEGDRFTQVIVLLSAASLWYAWIFSIVYITETVILVLAFVFSGVMIALALLMGVTEVKEEKGTDRTGAKMGLIGVVVAVLLVSLSGMYVTLERTWGSLLFYRGLYVVNQVGDVEKAERLLARAVTHNPKADVYYRALSNIQFIRLGQLAQTTDEDPEILQAKFKGVLETTIANSARAIALNPGNYANYLSLGQVYESLVPFRVEGAAQQAKIQYDQALKLNPGNPAILFSIARLSMASGNSTGARNFLTQSLQEKPNFAAAILVLAQIEAAEGRIFEAIRRTEEAAGMYPNDPSVFFQLGFYYYQNGQYQKAVEVLRRVIALSPNNVNVNAQYFLGLSYDRLGDRGNALKQFEQIAVYNPDNQEVKTIIANLRAGSSAVAAPAPIAEEVDNEEEE